MKIRLFLILSLIVLATGSYAQDTIYLKDGSRQTVWIIEKSDKLVKYRIMNTTDSPVVILKSNKIEKIVYRNGDVTFLTPETVRMQKRLGLNTGLMYGLSIESAFWKFQADYFITPAMNLQVSGLVESEDGGGIFIGSKYYSNPYSTNKRKGYAGLDVGFLWDELIVQVPFGLSITGSKGFDFKLGFTGVYSPGYEGFGGYAEMLIGWRF